MDEFEQPFPIRETVYVSTAFYQVSNLSLSKAWDFSAHPLSTSHHVQRPSAEKRIVEFRVLYDADGQPTAPRDGLIESISFEREGYRLQINYLTAISAADSDNNLNFRRFLWEYGNPEPEIISQLGIEVIA